MVQEVGSKVQLEENLEKAAAEIELKEAQLRGNNRDVLPTPRQAEDMKALMAMSGKIREGKK